MARPIEIWEHGTFGSLEGETAIHPSPKAWFNIEPVHFEGLCGGLINWCDMTYNYRLIGFAGFTQSLKKWVLNSIGLDWNLAFRWIEAQFSTRKQCKFLPMKSFKTQSGSLQRRAKPQVSPNYCHGNGMNWVKYCKMRCYSNRSEWRGMFNLYTNPVCVTSVSPLWYLLPCKMNQNGNLIRKDIWKMNENYGKQRKPQLVTGQSLLGQAFQQRSPGLRALQNFSSSMSVQVWVKSSVMAIY